jgi:hypothetical protein
MAKGAARSTLSDWHDDSQKYAFGRIGIECFESRDYLEIYKRPQDVQNQLSQQKSCIADKLSPTAASFRTKSLTRIVVLLYCPAAPFRRRGFLEARSPLSICEGTRRDWHGRLYYSATRGISECWARSTQNGRLSQGGSLISCPVPSNCSSARTVAEAVSIFRICPITTRTPALAPSLPRKILPQTGRGWFWKARPNHHDIHIDLDHLRPPIL